MSHSITQHDVSLDDPVAVVGFAKNIEIPSMEAADREQALHCHTQAIRECLRDAGVPMARLRQRNASTVIGLNHKVNFDDQPNMVAPRVSKELGLAQSGLTVEFGEVSGMAALHFAKADLVTGKHGFAVVAELVASDSGHATMNVVLLQLLSEAMQDGHQVHGLIKGTALGFQSQSERLLSECCEKAQISRGQVLMVDYPNGEGLAKILTWIAMGEAEPAESQNDLDTAGFTTFARSSGTQVALLLQAPMVSASVCDDEELQTSLVGDLAAAEGAFCTFFEDQVQRSPYWPFQIAHEASVGSYGLKSSSSLPLVDLHWRGSGDTPMFLSFQQGEI